MATPMQYELINALLAANQDERWLASQTPEIQRAYPFALDAYRDSVLVDVTNVVANLLDAVSADSAAPGMVDLTADTLLKFVRPCEPPVCDPPHYRTPWPRIAMMTGRVGAIIPQMWFVRESNEVPGFSLSNSAFANGFLEIAHSTAPNGTWHNAVTRAALAIASAKNADWVLSEPNRNIRRRHPLLAGIRFRHIDIDMGKPRRRDNRAHEPTGAHVPWHHRRGHMAYVHPDRPLFGRAGEWGWYWKPYVEVGDKANGVIVQDYSIKANLPRLSA